MGEAVWIGGAAQPVNKFVGSVFDVKTFDIYLCLKVQKSRVFRYICAFPSLTRLLRAKFRVDRHFAV